VASDWLRSKVPKLYKGANSSRKRIRNTRHGEAQCNRTICHQLRREDHGFAIAQSSVCHLQVAMLSASKTYIGQTNEPFSMGENETLATASSDKHLRICSNGHSPNQSFENKDSRRWHVVMAKLQHIS
jgi:hypothetical protein